jgi:3-phenylpropionate/cinnamic acid dioxygenase small subunit
MTARHEFEDVFCQYALAFDEGETERYALVFAEDAELIAGPTTLSGRDAIVEMMSGRIAFRRGESQQTRHVITNILVEEETESRARVRAYFSLPVTTGGSSLAVERTGWYLSDFVRTGDGWRIARHEMHGDQG